MIAGHLQIKNDNYYMVLNYTDANGKRRQPWIPTGLPAKGNKRRAEKLLLDTRKSFVPPVVSKENEDISSDMLFADYMELWLEIIRSSVEKTTFSSYTQMVKGKIAPYFRNTGLTLDGIQAKHIQSFYLHELKTVSLGTVIHYHANIHKALKYAVKMDLIPFNPADKVERPKKQRYIADYYRQEELERLLEASKDHPYCFYTSPNLLLWGHYIGYSNQPPFTFFSEVNQDVVISLLLLRCVKFISNTAHTDNIIWNVRGYFEFLPQPTHYVMNRS